MTDATYVVKVEREDAGNPKSGPAIIQAGAGCHTLEKCQAMAQRMEETGHGKSTIGLFQPLTKQEQRDISNV